MSDDRPGCAHHLHLSVRRGDPEPTLVCSCPGGLIHMHDCPVMNGRECRFFQEGEGEALEPAAYEEAHTALMADFLSRTYIHRVRGLFPEGDPWGARRREIEERYAEETDEDPSDRELSPEEQERYEEEKERLIAQRKHREEARAEREAKTREEKARERAKMGIKTVVERAQESVAARGNVSDSIVDDMPAPERPAKKKRRRKRRRRPEGGDRAKSAPSGSPGGKGSGEGPSGDKPSGDRPPRKRRRRRRRRGPKKQGGDSA
jgi:hypothetical protein